MKLIDGNTALRQCIPNTLATVPGETSWFEKLNPFLEEAERWLADHITGDAVIDRLSNQQDISPERMAAARIVTTHALITAIPSLDLVLTPNGFGIVNTQTVVPASKERIERLIDSVEKERDQNIDLLLSKLAADESWMATRQAEFFGATLFPRLTLCYRLAIREHMWSEYQKLRERLIKIESVLAETYFSQEQMEVFRAKVIRMETVSPLMGRVIREIQSLEMLIVTDLKTHPQSFYDIVNTIREHEEVFPEWHASKTAELYSPKVYINDASKSGYWF